MEKCDGKLIVIVAPSGSGKSTLIEKIKIKYPTLVESVSCTTRPCRTGEENGVHYHFLKVDDFTKRRDSGEFLEWAQVHSNFYGTSKKFVRDGLDRGDHILFDLDVQGADAMKKQFGKEANIIYIEPPSVEELEDRLMKRATDAREVILERINNAKSELIRKNDFDFLVKNDDLETAENELSKIIGKILKGHVLGT